MAQDFGQIVDDEPIAGCEHLAPDDVDLPSGQIGMQPIDEGAVVELRRQGFENHLQGIRRRDMGVTMAIDELGLDAKVAGFSKKIHSARCLHATVRAGVAKLSNTGGR